MAQTIKLLIADDHAVVRTGLVQMLQNEPDIEVVGEARDGIEAIQKALELKPDVIIMDIFMPRAGGLEATVEIKGKMPEARVLILTISEQESDLLQALRLGAQGYLLKCADVSEIVNAVRKTFAGEAVLSPNIAVKLAAELKQKANEVALSTREREVLQFLGEGLSNTEISKRMFIDESTVRTYIHRLLEKLHLNNRAEAANYAKRHGVGTMPWVSPQILPPPDSSGVAEYMYSRMRSPYTRIPAY